MPTALSPELFYLELAGDILAEQEAADPSRAAALPTPLEWASANARIVTPSQGVAPWEPYPYQQKLLQDTTPRRLVLKARQTGLSTAIALEALYYATHLEHDRTLFVSRNQDAASLLIRYCQIAISGMATPVKTTGESQSKLSFSNGSEILSLPATPSTGRSYPASRVYLDEFAFAEYADLIYQAILPTLSGGGPLTVQSTPKGRNNLFFRFWQGFEGGGWSRHIIHWQDCPRYRDDPSWESKTRSSMTRQAFAEEFDCDFVSSGDAVFDPTDILACRVGHVDTPTACDQFITAWDIGRRQDHTVGITLGRAGDVWHVIEMERFMAPYPVIQAAIEARGKRFGRTLVESNGVGDPVIENLMVRVDPFLTTVKSKTQAIQALQLLIQQGQFKFGPAHEQLERELSLYEFDDKNLVQDTVMAASIAAQAVNKPRGGIWFA